VLPFRYDNTTKLALVRKWGKHSKTAKPTPTSSVRTADMCMNIIMIMHNTVQNSYDNSGHKPGILREFSEPGKLREFCATSGKNYNK